MKDKNIDKCLEINIQALKDSGYIDDNEELSEKELAELRKIIKHAKCENCGNESCTKEFVK